MKKFLIVPCFSFLSVTVCAQSKIDVLHYEYYIELNDRNDTVYGNARIYFVANEPVSEINFDLTGLNYNKKGMVVTEVIYDPFSANLLFYKQEKNKLNIRLNDNLKKGDTSSLRIFYKGIPSDGLIISENKYGHRTFFADNWPDRAHYWIPCVDDPADKASVEFIVTAPSHYQVISNGIQIEESNLRDNKKLTHWKEDLPLSTKVMVIGVADFAVSRVGDINCVPVYSWVFPENKKEGFTDYAMAKDILSFFINYIGPYPYKKLANVQSKTRFGGMENAGAIFYFENSVTGSRNQETLLAHEIVHQWFGDMATEKSFAHLWLSEGFATYLTHIYVESKYGTDSLNKRMRSEREEIIDFVKTSHKPVVDSVSPYMQLLNTNSYQKGGWVLHMLRRQLGDSVFKKSIRTYYETFAGKNADTRDLQRVFESVSGKDLEQFFTQWLYRPENPKLDISWKYNKTEKNIAVTVKQLQPRGNFQFPLEIQIQEQNNSNPVKKLIHISKNSETFLIPLQSGPASFEVDPMISLLFEGTVKEIR
jgi:aminopeptidase N